MNATSLGNNPNLEYVSTRGKAPKIDFKEALLGGLASDGGLYVPESWPDFLPEFESALASKDAVTYPDLASQLIYKFTGSFIDPQELNQLTQNAYKSFTDKKVIPLKYVPEFDFYLLELFHGPTLAFKDVALQLVGGLFEQALIQENQKAVIVTATSGDTGAAAIHACLGRKNLMAIVLHPQGLVSETQRRMMTSVDAPNIKNIAIEGNFDDCQELVKGLFGDPDLTHHNLAAMNSINWARIAAQSVYYFYAISQLYAIAPQFKDMGVVFSVPSGNFGNIYSGWVAAQMGAPIKQLIAAVNVNDTLARFIKSSELNLNTTQPSLAPAMDVSVPSNLERLIFELYERSGNRVDELYSSLRDSRKYESRKYESRKYESRKDESRMGEPNRLQNFSSGESELSTLWDAYSVQDDFIKSTIYDIRQRSGIWIDPHTAVGVKALFEARDKNPKIKDHPQVVLATAHPAKFEKLYLDAEDPPKLPSSFADLKSRPEDYEVLPNDLKVLKDYIAHIAKW